MVRAVLPTRITLCLLTLDLIWVLFPIHLVSCCISSVLDFSVLPRIIKSFRNCLPFLWLFLNRWISIQPSRYHSVISMVKPVLCKHWPNLFFSLKFLFCYEYKRIEIDSSQRLAVFWSGRTRGNEQILGEAFSPQGRSKSSTSCPERLWKLHLCRYSNFD